MNSIWNQCLAVLERDLEKHDYDRWVAPLDGFQVSDSLIQINAPDEYFADRLNAHPVWVKIQSTLNAVSKLPLRINLEAYEDTTPPVKPRSIITSSEADVKIREAGLQPQFSFSNFINGESNSMVCAAAKQIAENAQASLYNPFFVYGRSGLGKTHLVYAIGNHLIRHSKTKVLYQHSHRFVSNFVAALHNKEMLNFKKFYRSFDVLLIDDVHLFADKTGTQEELFQVINLMLEGHKQVVFTCDRYPKDLSGFTDRLRSRFGAGLALEVKPPELELRVAILKAKAQEVNFDLPEEVAFLVAKKIRSNVRELTSALATLKAYHEFSGKTVSIVSATNALEHAFAAHSRSVTLEQIIKTVASYYHLRVIDLTSRIRRQPIVRARHLSMALSKQLTAHSLSEIGACYSRDHSTVLHACKKVESLRVSNTAFNSDYENLYATLSS